MIIDFHTHVFPDKIAKKTIDFLSQKCNIPAYSDGSVAGLVSEMEKADADIAITLPIVTNPTQFDSINRFASEVNLAFADKKRRLISFGGIHPECENIDEKMKYIRESGLLGVKIHPEYQETYINDEKYIKIMECAREYDLIVVTHSGIDAGYRDRDARCSPERVKELIKKVPHTKFVLAHYGANEQSEAVIDILCGENVYFDTALILGSIGKERFTEILKKHGEDKILFASDSPWSSIKDDLESLRSFSLSNETEKKILYKNALKLLGI